MRGQPVFDSPGTTEARRWTAGPRVAIVHDWLLGMRGGERVLEALLDLFPRAEIYTLFYHPRGVSAMINRRAIHPSPLSSLPFVRRYYRNLLPLMPSAMSRLRIRRGTDLVLSTSHCVAHGIAAPPGARHLTYCFSPMRYLYDQSEAYAQGGAAVGARLLELLAPRLRRWDRRAARRCGQYWAISGAVAERIKRVYGLDAPVIHPPVQTDFFTPSRDPVPPDALDLADAPYLIVSAFTPYKRLDVAIEAANTLGKPLLIAGKGPLEARLRALAGPSVRFAGWVNDARLRELYRSCRALIFPGSEDFGIVPLEAMACGKPVLALRSGGLTETLAEGVTGEFFDVLDAPTLARAWESFQPDRYDPAAIRRHAERFSTARFLDSFASKLHAWMNEERA